MPNVLEDTRTVNTTVTSKPSPPTSRKEREARTAELVHQLDSASGESRDEIVRQLVEINMPVAHVLAKHYSGRGMATEDLEQVAYLGLVAATRRFDPSRGYDFLSYVVPSIKGELRRCFRDLGWMVRPPRRLQELQVRVWAAEADLTHVLERSPTTEEIAEEVGASVDEVHEALAIDGCFSPTSLDARIGEDDGATLAERQGRTDPGFAHCEAREVLRPVLDRLGKRDRKIVELRYYRGWNQRRIGEEIGVTQTQVSRLIGRILIDMREELEDDELPVAA